jgi:tRNA-modifying protein YgfZ
MTGATASSGGVRVRRDVIVAHGADTVSFLQGQLSQDVAAMVPGDVRWSLHLTPQGRVIALVRLTRISGDAVVIDTEAGSGQEVRANLSRFKIRTKCDLDMRADVVSALSLDSHTVTASTTDLASLTAAEAISGAPMTLPGFPRAGGFDVLGAPDDETLTAESDYAAWRVTHGVPSAGAELTEQFLPPETGLVPIAVAFGKGCYVGQELVERIDSRGRVNRILCALRTSQGAQTTLASGSTVERADTASTVGVVTTGGDGRALAYLRRDAMEAAKGDGVQLTVDGQSVSAELLPDLTAVAEPPKGVVSGLSMRRPAGSA